MASGNATFFASNFPRVLNSTTISVWRKRSRPARFRVPVLAGVTKSRYEITNHMIAILPVLLLLYQDDKDKDYTTLISKDDKTKIEEEKKESRYRFEMFL